MNNFFQTVAQAEETFHAAEHTSQWQSFTSRVDRDNEPLFRGIVKMLLGYTHANNNASTAEWLLMKLGKAVFHHSVTHEDEEGEYEVAEAYTDLEKAWRFVYEGEEYAAWVNPVEEDEDDESLYLGKSTMEKIRSQKLVNPDEKELKVTDEQIQEWERALDTLSALGGIDDELMPDE